MRAAITIETLLAPAFCQVDMIEASIQNLLQIKSDLYLSSYPPVFEDDANDKIIDMGGYPCAELFNVNISKLSVCAYSGRDVSRLVAQILGRAVAISAVDPEFIAEWRGSTVTPLIPSLPQRQESLTRLVESVALRSSLGGVVGCVVHHFSGMASNSIYFSGVLSSVYPDLIRDVPTQIESEVKVSNTYLEHFLQLDPDEFFAKAASEYDVKFAYYIGVVQLLKTRGDDWTEFLYESFELGASFVDSLHRNQCFYGQRFFNVCYQSVIRVLAEHPGSEVKPFRESENSDVQRKRNDDTAWRAHITKHHEALRLMFWKTESGVVELANVGCKQELRIVE